MKAYRVSIIATGMMALTAIANTAYAEDGCTTLAGQTVCGCTMDDGTQQVVVLNQSGPEGQCTVNFAASAGTIGQLEDNVNSGSGVGWGCMSTEGSCADLTVQQVCDTARSCENLHNVQQARLCGGVGVGPLSDGNPDNPTTYNPICNGAPVITGGYTQDPLPPGSGASFEGYTP
jgi:hypothetical protein